MRIQPHNLRTPGPTPIPDEIYEAMSDPMINHRGPEFFELITECTEMLKQVFMTDNDLFILTSSGTGGLEASVVNTLSPGDRVLAASAGSFGDRFADMLDAYGVDTQRITFEWGEAIDPEAIRQSLRDAPETRAVIVTHNETSTGVTHDLQSISSVVKGEFGKLLIVDAVSSLGCVPLPVDGWDCDVVATGSQKGFMVPPGLAFISFSDEAWESQKSSTLPPVLFRPGRGEEVPGAATDPVDAEPFGHVRAASGAGKYHGRGSGRCLRTPCRHRAVHQGRRTGPGPGTALRRRGPRFQHRHRHQDADAH